ncbi:hypothetical protein BA6E_104169 [Bacteroidales bacterium 6E]|nr:hypothetical protein BA6E_104169 [Bacteroidales bacterium 6E]
MLALILWKTYSYTIVLEIEGIKLTDTFFKKCVLN